MLFRISGQRQSSPLETATILIHIVSFLFFPSRFYWLGVKIYSSYKCPAAQFWASIATSLDEVSVLQIHWTSLHELVPRGPKTSPATQPRAATDSKHTRFLIFEKDKANLLCPQWEIDCSPIQHSTSYFALWHAMPRQHLISDTGIQDFATSGTLIHSIETATV